jgi:anti-anti-sigma factor
MAIEHNDLSGGLRHIVLSGRLDFHGVEKIIGQLSSLLTASGSNALIDLTQATLICSMGIRALILNAKNMQQRGRRMALVVDDGTIVSTTLKSVGIDSLLPVFTSLPDAKKAMLQ